MENLIEIDGHFIEIKNKFEFACLLESWWALLSESGSTLTLHITPSHTRTDVRRRLDVQHAESKEERGEGQDHAGKLLRWCQSSCLCVCDDSTTVQNHASLSRLIAHHTTSPPLPPHQQQPPPHQPSRLTSLKTQQQTRRRRSRR